ncbi:uncharacterized protein LOC129042061 [Pongo pygmaeus]|uniref:uncharacterized protein LOC129042061 n=1 Tax=Pongo pygmaeus TaxID=9600 RepID=UPI00300D3378
MRGIRILNPIPSDCRVAVPAVPGSGRGGAERVAPPGGPSGLARTHSGGRQGHAPSPGRPSCRPKFLGGLWFWGGSRICGCSLGAARQLPSPLTLPASQNRGQKSRWLRPSQAFCRAAAAQGQELRTCRSTPSRVTAECPCQRLLSPCSGGAGREARPRGPQAARWRSRGRPGYAPPARLGTQAAVALCVQAAASGKPLSPPALRTSKNQDQMSPWLLPSQAVRPMAAAQGREPAAQSHPRWLRTASGQRSRAPAEEEGGWHDPGFEGRLRFLGGSRIWWWITDLGLGGGMERLPGAAAAQERVVGRLRSRHHEEALQLLETPGPGGPAPSTTSTRVPGTTSGTRNCGRSTGRQSGATPQRWIAA